MLRLIHPIKYNYSRSFCRRFSLSAFPRKALPVGGFRTRFWRRMDGHRLATGSIYPRAPSWRGSPPIGRPPFCSLPRWFCSAVSSISAARRIPAIRSRQRAGKKSARLRAALPGSTATPFFWRFCCFLPFRLRCISSSARRPTTRNARSRVSHRSPSQHLCFRRNSGRQPCKHGRRNIWQSRSLSCSAPFCARRDQRNPSRSVRETKQPAGRTSEQETALKG